MAKQQIPGSTECISSLEKKHAVEIMRTTNTENAIIDVSVLFFHYLVVIQIITDLCHHAKKLTLQIVIHRGP